MAHSKGHGRTTLHAAAREVCPLARREHQLGLPEPTTS
jgi:hypothetical protein